MAKNKAAEVEQEVLPAKEGPKLRKKVVGIEASSAITVLSESNPKRAGSQAHKDWDIYADSGAKTVQEFYDAGGNKASIAYDFMHGFIDCAGAEVVEYEVTPRGPKAEAETEEVAVMEESEDQF